MCRIKRLLNTPCSCNQGEGARIFLAKDISTILDSFNQIICVEDGYIWCLEAGMYMRRYVHSVENVIYKP